MSTEQTTGEFRLARQIHGPGAFAHVRVEVRPDPAGGVHLSVSDVQRRRPNAAETRAALDGAAGALGDLDRQGVDTRGRSVHVTFVGITEVDTEPTAVRAAAAAATVAAFGAADRFTLTYADGWRYRPADAV